MDIQIDTREKQRAIRKILKTFDDNGVKHFSSKLLVGDYMSLDNPRLIIDRKQNLQELCGNVCQQHERFKRELLKAINAGIQLVILVEHGPDIQSLEDVWFWENPRKHEVRWRMVNGKREKYVVSAKVYVDNVISMDDEVLGSTYFLAPPGETTVQIHCSEFSTPEPTVKAYIREAFI